MSIAIQPAEQALSLAYALLLGLGSGFLYDVLRQVRLGRPALWTHATDALYWLIITLLVLVFSVVGSDGYIRFGLFFVQVLGAVLYFYALSPILRRLLHRLARVLACLWHLLCFPLRLFYALYKKISPICKKSLKNIFSFLEKSVRMRFMLKQSHKRAQVSSDAKGVLYENRQSHPPQKGWHTDEKRCGHSHADFGHHPLEQPPQYPKRKE